MARTGIDRVRAAFRPRAAPATHTSLRVTPPLWLSLLLILLLTLPLLWVSLVNTRQIRVDVGVWGDHTLLRGVNGIEQAAGENYRWTTDQARLTLPNLSPSYRLLRLRGHGWRPPSLTPPTVFLDLSGRPFGSFQLAAETRVVSLLLPAEPGMQRQIGLRVVPAYHPPGDPRWLGIGVDWLTLGTTDPRPVPLLAQLGGQALLLALLLLLVGLLALPSCWTLILAAFVAALLPWANLHEPLWVSGALPQLLLLVSGLLLGSWLLAGLLVRLLVPWATPAQARLAWALFVGALALRLAGSLHPLFDAHDLPVHTRWLSTVAGGELYLYSTPAELRNQQTFNPPAAYLLLLPLGLLVSDDRLLVQVGVALLDALGCLVLLGIARELRLPASAGLLALGLALGLPISLTMLWWGFAANAIAQALWLLLLWTLLRLVRCPTPFLTAALAVLLAIGMLTHVGALVLLVALLGLLLPLGWRRVSPAGRRALALAVVAALLFVAPVYFAAAAGPVLEQEVDPAKRSLAATLARGWEHRWLRLDLVSRGWLLGYLAPTLLLAPLGIVLLARAPRRHPLQRSLIAAWLIVSLIFFLAYMGLALLTRYIYFAAPLICLALGALLDHLRRRPAGRTVALALTLLVFFAGASLWFEGVLLRVKPSVTPLSH